MTFGRVLVAGAGQMGAGIAQVVAASGREVLLYDAFPGAATTCAIPAPIWPAPATSTRPKVIAGGYSAPRGRAGGA